MNNKKEQLTFDTIHDGFTEEEKLSASEVAKRVEQQKTRVKSFYGERMVKVDKPLLVGTDEDRGERDYAFDRQFPDERHFSYYHYLTDAKDKGPLLMTPRQGGELFYCPNGIDSYGRAEAMRIDNTTMEEFLEIWNH